MQPNRQHESDEVALYFPPEHHVASPYGSPTMQIIPGGPFGSARLATPAELRWLCTDADDNRFGYLRLFGGFGIGHDGMRPEPVYFDSLPLPVDLSSANVLAVGRSGAGKTSSVLFPTIYDAITRGLNVVAVVAKGRSHSKRIYSFARRAGRHGEFHLIAPNKPEVTSASTLIEDAADGTKARLIANALVSAATEGAQHREGVWAYNQAIDFLENAIRAVSSDGTAGGRSLVVIRHVILTGSYREFAEAHPEYPALQAWAVYYNSGNNNSSTVAATLQEATSFIDGVTPFLSRSELDVAAFSEKGGILVIEVDECDVDALRPVVSILVTRLIGGLQRAAATSADGRLKTTTVVFIDELTVAGKIPQFPTVLHTCREADFHFVAGVQSVGQIYATYGPNAESVLAGFHTQIVFGAGLDQASAEYFSRKTGTMTIAVHPNPDVERDGETITEGGHWQLTSRSVLLPADIAFPRPHSLLGAPATVFFGDARVPVFQAYLTPVYEVGSLAKLFEEARSDSSLDHRRSEPLRAFSSCVLASEKANIGITDSSSLTDEEVYNRLQCVKEAIGWSETDGSARDLWETFEKETFPRLRVVLRCAEELLIRQATIQELYQAHVDGGSDNVQACLYFLDYQRLKSREDDQKRDQDSTGEIQHGR